MPLAEVLVCTIQHTCFATYPPKHDKLMNATYRAHRAEMDRQHNDQVVGRKRPRYNDTPPPSPARSSAPDLIRRPSFRGQGYRNAQGGRGGHGGRDRPQQTLPRNFDRELDEMLTGSRMPAYVLDRLEFRWGELKAEIAREAMGARKAKENEQAIVGLINTREDENRQRCLEISDLRASNWRLDKETMRMQRKVEKQAATLKTLHARRATKVEDPQTINRLKQENIKLQEQHEIESGLLRFNTKVQVENMIERENMAKKLASLREMIDAKERVIFTMDSQLHAMATASPQDATRMAREAQAQRTLSMVQGLHKDVADRDEVIERLQGLLKDQDASRKTNEEQTEALKAAEKRAANAENRLAEMKATADSQREVIDKLVIQNRENLKMSFY